MRFRVRVTEHEALECNCSVCAKKAFLHLLVTEADFALVSGSDALTTYTFNTGVAKHMFCRVCGIHSFYRPRSHPDGWSINVRCLDGDAPSRFRIQPFDGQNWEANVGAIR